MAERGVLPTRNSSRIRSKIRMFVSTAMPIVSAMPARPGRVRVARMAAMKAKQDQEVQAERHVRDEPGEPVVDEHEDEHDDRRAR